MTPPGGIYFVWTGALVLGVIWFLRGLGALVDGK
jgi:hypothetical protein